MGLENKLRADFDTRCTSVVAHPSPTWSLEWGVRHVKKGSSLVDS